VEGGESEGLEKRDNISYRCILFDGTHAFSSFLCTPAACTVSRGSPPLSNLSFSDAAFRKSCVLSANASKLRFNNLECLFRHKLPMYIWIKVDVVAAVHPLPAVLLLGGAALTSICLTEGGRPGRQPHGSQPRVIVRPRLEPLHRHAGEPLPPLVTYLAHT
jgi:hypothetical protein